jgi:hypothetical protein
MKSDESLNRIARLLKSWEHDLRDQDRLEAIVTAFMEAKTTKEVNEIILSNINFIDRMGLWRKANLAKRRINKLRAMTIKLTEIIYLN